MGIITAGWGTWICEAARTVERWSWRAVPVPPGRHFVARSANWLRRGPRGSAAPLHWCREDLTKTANVRSMFLYRDCFAQGKLGSELNRFGGLVGQSQRAADDLLSFARGPGTAINGSPESQATRMVQKTGTFNGAAPTSVLVCQSNLDFMRPLRSGGMNLIVTSPPYNIGKSYERRTSLDRYIKEQAKVIAECIRLLHPLGSLCWQVGNHVQGGEVFPLDVMLYPVFSHHGLKLRNRIIWHFEHGLHCTNRLSGRHETILWFTKGDKYTFDLDQIRVPSKYPAKKYFKGPKKGQLSGNPLGKNPGDVWIFPNVKNNHVEKTVHPCQFPVELVERLVLSMTKPSDNVLDPYMGVGSAPVAAVMHSRNGFGCDTEPEYVEIARQRVNLARAGLLPTRPMTRPVYDPKLPCGGHR